MNACPGVDEPGDRSDGHSHLHALAGWQVELYADAESPASLACLLIRPIRLIRLPAMCIDHLGLSRAGRPILLRLVEPGVPVKASAFGRLDLDLAAARREIAARRATALKFATHLSSTRAPWAFADADLGRKVLEPELAERVSWHNAVEFHRPRPSPCV